MNYSALTSEELIARAESDPGARVYIGEHIQRLWSDAVDDCENMQASFDEGWSESRSHLMGMYGEEIEELCEKYDQDPENADLVRLLNALYAEFNGEGEGP